jgi:hypothetical protein
MAYTNDTNNTMPFTINILRGNDYGTLTFECGEVKVNTQCWWDPALKIDAGTYIGAATRMAHKTDGFDRGKREAIYLGQGVWCNNSSRQSNGIFIHKGTGPSWSGGCIVADADKVLSIWQCINPKELYIVSIVVSDQSSDQPWDSAERPGDGCPASSARNRLFFGL